MWVSPKISSSLRHFSNKIRKISRPAKKFRKKNFQSCVLNLLLPGLMKFGPRRSWSGHFVKLGRCLLYPQRRTLPSGTWMSALCQKRTSHQRCPMFGRGVPKTAIAPTTSSQNGTTPTPGIASRTSPGKSSHCQPSTTNKSLQSRHRPPIRSAAPSSRKHL
jgi:hypothetical protein